MIISNRPASHDIKFTLADTNLTRLDETKDLGILFNSRLNFSTHISTIMTNAKQRLYLLRKSFSSCDCDALILAFKTYIISLVEYCSPVWSPSSVGDILKIESIQRSFTKSLNICSSLTYSERLTVCGLRSLEYRRLVADLVLFYKIVNKLTVIDLGDSLPVL